ncbi:hypothetical protein P0D88_19530 [Paraburkholderia sp. RL18-103-BIB-C]|jgi:hypothetical protein|uniref:hypothetical protein n=1 Tax=unclassified Paraburkholderia TaxID=2615204 RepID=UPI002F69CFEC
MNRPLALIQGNLALPNARLLRGLPPPYGVYRWPPRNAAQRRPQPAAVIAAHQVIRDVARRNSPQERRIPFAPGQRSRFFYKLPKPRDNSSCFDAQMDESRHYLEMRMTRWYSSRADRILGGVIFVACSIALAWLLTTTAAHDADKRATMAIARSSVAMPGAAQPSVEVALKPARSARAAAPTPKAVLRSEPRPPLQALRPAKPNANNKSTSTRPGESQFDEHRAATVTIRPAIRSAASMQPEWPPRPSPDAAAADREAIDQAAWLDWTIAQQHHRRTSVTTRANTSAPASNDTDWNAHMTQRRITDNPSVFATPSAQN